MSSTTSSPEQTERVATVRLWWVGLLAVIASVAANAIVRTIAAALFDVHPEFRPLKWPQFTAFTVIGVAGAVIVFWGIARRAQRPIRLFQIIAAVVLLLSLLPDFGLLATRPFPGTNAQTVGTLMMMHVVTAAITVGLLTRLARERS